MLKCNLTVLTDPMPIGRNLFPETGRHFARVLKYAVRKRSFSSHPRYRGHFAVTRSLVEGLERIGADFNYNPTSLTQLGDTVLVLAGVRTLRQAVRLKQQGYIQRLFAGPNIVVFSDDCDSILASPEVDWVITPCDWVIELYIRDNPSLTGRCFSWPAGVDTAYWDTDPSFRRNRILIFEKQQKGPVGPVEPYAEYLRGLGMPVDILRYGTFHHDQYRKLLQQSCLMLGFVTDESQGIAWAEAWAMDVPTLIWRNTSQMYGGRQYKCSTAPYLCNANGLFFDDLEDFKRQFAFWESNQAQFQPRAWTLDNMSDEVCARRLYEKITSC